jgi:hypothetical protein
MVLQNGSAVSIGQMVNQFIASRQLNHREYHHLCTILLSDNQLDDEERLQINRLLDAIQSGQLKVVS